ncbi:hypothetical protein CAPTEDRAFT_165457 [Capitella teleta]|uniref:NADH dehydrogenase [ubiquinone] 1 alpha subcomplex subunit 5 n=1 Tax=Capitella teleta TaxID=283909 RepID=R7TB01_CAPTE|nr:hypothetical protein CAPTEDRAFT_165457 [Capitella teleta]|eukprot:ELT90874.1 hypothetical protein CAPTEDRAFT_165457 [Capitella teleta]
MSMSRILKQTTNLTGLSVAEKPLKQLKILYTRTLKVLQEMPEDAAYRKHTQALTQTRLNVVTETTDPVKAEGLIKQGQIEEVILQAERELSLAQKMVEWKPWQPLAGEAPANQWKWPI